MLAVVVVDHIPVLQGPLEELEVLVVVETVVQKHLQDLEHPEPMQLVEEEVVEDLLDHQYLDPTVVPVS
jgi:hypothetical protein